LDDNPQAHLLALCAAFLQDIDNYTNGKPQYDPNQRAFLQDAFLLYQSLKTEVNETKPDFLVGTSSTQLPSLIEATHPALQMPPVMFDYKNPELSQSASSSSDENKLKETKSTSVSKKSAKGGETHRFTYLTTRNFFGVRCRQNPRDVNSGTLRYHPVSRSRVLHRSLR